jgi:hypothetical protein
MELHKFVEVESEKRTSTSQWSQDPIKDVVIHLSVLQTNVALRKFSSLENIVVGGFSGRASGHAYKIGNFNLRLMNNANEVYTMTVPNTILTRGDAILAHASGQNSWIVPIWENPNFVLLSTYLSPIWVKLKEIMKLPANWDSYGAVPITTRTIAKTIEILVESFKIQHRLGYERIIPFVAPCADGSIQAEWEIGTKELEVVIPSSENEKISLLRVSEDREEFKESTISSPEEISEYLLWLLRE